MSERRLFERTRRGQRLISAFVVVVVALMVGQSQPYRIPRALTTPLAETVGLEQRWAMFSRPPAASIAVYADVEMADGTVERWHPPGSGVITRGARAEHWRRWWEQLHRRHGSSASVPLGPVANLIARAYRLQGHEPRSVRIVERRRATPPVGESAPDWVTTLDRTIVLDTSAGT